MGLDFKSDNKKHHVRGLKCEALWRNGQRVGLLVKLRRSDSKVVGSSPTRVDI